MNNEIFEKGQDMQTVSDYHLYQQLGGIINEKDFDSAMERVGEWESIAPDTIAIKQAENMADIAGIELNGIRNSIDPRIKLYVILRKDVRPTGVQHHHDEMSDQQIFVEALRMTGDAESVQRMIERHPNINFKYKEDSK